MKRIALFEEETDINVHTYDSIVNWYTENQRQNKNILSLTGKSFKFKRVNTNIGNMLAHMRPNELILDKVLRQKLIDEGYEIEAWEGGELLRYGGMNTGRAVFGD